MLLRCAVLYHVTLSSTRHKNRMFTFPKKEGILWFKTNPTLTPWTHVQSRSCLLINVDNLSQKKRRLIDRWPEVWNSFTRDKQVHKSNNNNTDWYWHWRFKRYKQGHDQKINVYRKVSVSSETLLENFLPNMLCIFPTKTGSYVGN